LQSEKVGAILLTKHKYVNKLHTFTNLIITLNTLNMSNKSNSLTTKRFVIRKSLLGKNTVITFTNKKGDTITYNHDKVYEVNKERFESMNCFKKYKSYTNTNNIPTFCRDLT
jgi:hypothetical protein